MTKIIRANFLSFNFWYRLYHYRFSILNLHAQAQAHCIPYKSDVWLISYRFIHSLVCCVFFSVSRVQLSRGSHVCFKQINLSKRNTFAAQSTPTIAHKHEHEPKLYHCLSPFLQVNTIARVFDTCACE